MPPAPLDCRSHTADPFTVTRAVARVEFPSYRRRRPRGLRVCSTAAPGYPRPVPRPPPARGSLTSWWPAAPPFPECEPAGNRSERVRRASGARLPRPNTASPSRLETLGGLRPRPHQAARLSRSSEPLDIAVSGSRTLRSELPRDIRRANHLRETPGAAGNDPGGKEAGREGRRT